MSKKKKMSPTTFVKIFTFLFFMALGAFAVSYEFRYFGKMTIRYYVYTIGIFLVSIPLHVIVHEVGHLLTGLLSGYKFLMFRLFNQLWIQTDNGLSKRKQYIPGVLGQALMTPPEPNEGKQPPVLFYHLGGLLFNGLTALIFLIIGLQLANPSIRYFFYVSATTAFFLLVTNALPIKGTDGYNISQYLKVGVAKDETTMILYLYRDMVQGVPFQEIQKKIDLDDFQDFSKPHTTTLYTLHAATYLEELDFEQARAIYSTLWSKKDQLFAAHQIEISFNYFFTLLLTDPLHPAVAEIRQTKPFNTYRKQKLADSYRIFAAEALYLENNRTKALDLLNKGQKQIPYAPTVSDEKLERILYDYLKQEIQSK